MPVRVRVRVRVRGDRAGQVTVVLEVSIDNVHFEQPGAASGSPGASVAQLGADGTVFLPAGRDPGVLPGAYVRTSILSWPAGVTGGQVTATVASLP